MVSSKFSRRPRIQAEPAICHAPPAPPPPPTPSAPDCPHCTVGTTVTTAIVSLSGFIGSYSHLNGTYTVTQTPAIPCKLERNWTEGSFAQHIEVNFSTGTLTGKINLDGHTNEFTLYPAPAAQVNCKAYYPGKTFELDGDQWIGWGEVTFKITAAA